MQINILEAKNRLSELIKSAQAGEDIVIANRGEPVVKLVPVRQPAKRKPARVGSGARGLNHWLQHNPLPAHAARTAAQIDAALAEERAAWD